MVSAAAAATAAAAAVRGRFVAGCAAGVIVFAVLRAAALLAAGVGSSALRFTCGSFAPEPKKADKDPCLSMFKNRTQFFFPKVLRQLRAAQIKSGCNFDASSQNNSLLQED